MSTENYDEAYEEDEYGFEDVQEDYPEYPKESKPLPKKPGNQQVIASAPAHPLPATRHSHIDYDQYLQSPTNKFKIFSAENQRKRRRAALIGAVAGVVIVIFILWVVLGL